jgi:hypothetical protein
MPLLWSYPEARIIMEAYLKKIGYLLAVKLKECAIGLVPALAFQVLLSGREAARKAHLGKG